MYVSDFLTAAVTAHRDELIQVARRERTVRSAKSRSGARRGRVAAAVSRAIARPTGQITVTCSAR
jgi:hypothetical protein